MCLVDGVAQEDSQVAPEFTHAISFLLIPLPPFAPPFPTPFALGALGLVATHFFRRRKKDCTGRDSSSFQSVGQLRRRRKPAFPSYFPLCCTMFLYRMEISLGGDGSLNIANISNRNNQYQWRNGNNGSSIISSAWPYRVSPA